MRANDQPTIFGKTIIAAISSASDGNMSFGRGDAEETFQNRLAFLHAVRIRPDDTTLVQVTFDNAEHFARYSQVDDDQKGEGIFAPKSGTIADALVVTRPGHALFLPLADCAGVILYDEKQHVLMVSHVGRHSAEIDGAKTSVEYLVKQCNANPKDIKAWVSPAVGKATYPIHAKGGKSLHEIIHGQLLAAGVPEVRARQHTWSSAQGSTRGDREWLVLVR